MSGGPVLQTREEIDDLERQIERLRVMYQQYFMGTLKTEPLTLRKQIYRQILQAKPGQINNTGTRFKLRNLIQKWNGYLQMWKRNARQIEEGTFRRDIERVKRRQRAQTGAAPPPPAQGEEAPRQEAVEISDDLSAADLEAQLQAAMAREVAQTKTPPPHSHTPNSQAADQRLVEKIMERQAQGLSLDGLDLAELTGD